MKSHRVLFLPLLSLLLPSIAGAQWTTNGNAICLAAGIQGSVVSVSDGAGGAIMAWTDNRNGNSDIFAQRINGLGQTQWTADGAAVRAAANNQFGPAIAPDGAGGAFIFWQHLGNNGTTDIYGQHVNADGSLHWPGNGVLICGAQQDQLGLRAMADGSGGAIIAWQDNRQGSNAVSDVYAQRVNVAGDPQWTPDGVAVCTAANQQTFPQLVDDGSGGAIIAWTDARAAAHGVYIQHVDSAGLAQWTADGVALNTATQLSSACAITTDGSGGAIVAWSHYKDGVTFYDIFAQRINATGVVQWTNGGVPVCVAANGQQDPCVVPDGAGGAIIAFTDLRDEDITSYDLYAQRVNAAGIKQWAATAVPVDVSEGDLFDLSMVSDGGDGAIVSFIDGRAGFDVYAQRINGSGAVQWTVNGVPICTAASSQSEVRAVPDGSGGAIMAWGDFRGGPGSDIYAHRIGPGGTIPTRVPTTPIIAGTLLGQNHPNPFNPSTTIEYIVSVRSHVKIEIFDARGALVVRLDEGMREPGTHRAVWNAAPTVSSGVYFYRLAGTPAGESRKMVLVK